MGVEVTMEPSAAPPMMMSSEGWIRTGIGPAGHDEAAEDGPEHDD